MRHEHLGKLRLTLKERQHGFFRYRSDQAFFHRQRRRDAYRLAVETTFAEELIGSDNSDNRFLALIGCDDDFDLAFLKVEDGIRAIALGEDDLFLAEFRYVFPGPHLGEKHFGIEPVLGCFSHKTPPSVRRKL